MEVKIVVIEPLVEIEKTGKFVGLSFAYNNENLQTDFDVRNNLKFQCSKCYHSDSIWS